MDVAYAVGERMGDVFDQAGFVLVALAALIDNRVLMCCR